MKILNFSPIKSIALLLTLLSPIALVACEKKAENPAIKNSETSTEQKDVSMSAIPADKKEAPIAVADEGKGKAEVVKTLSATEGTVVTTTTTKEKTVTTAKPDTKNATAKAEEEDDEEDNSGMDSISEDDEVVDDTPASPDAPTAKEEKLSDKTPGHKKK